MVVNISTFELVVALALVIGGLILEFASLALAKVLLRGTEHGRDLEGEID